MSEENFKMDESDQVNIEASLNKDFGDSILEESIGDASFRQDDDGNDANSPENDENDSSVPNTTETPNQNAEQVDCEGEDLMMELFKKMEVLYDPKNVAFLLTSHKLEVQDYKRQLEQCKKENSDLFENARISIREKKKIELENRDLQRSLEKVDKFMQQIRQRYNSLVDTCSKLSTQSKELTNKYEKLYNKVEGSTTNKSDFYSVVAQLAAKEKDFAELQEKYEQLVSGHKSLIDEMKNIENANEQFQGELHKTEERAKNAENMLQDKTQAIADMQAQEEHVKVYINQLREEIVRITNANQSKEREFLNELARKDQEYEQRRGEYETQVGNSVEQLRENMNLIEEQAKSTENLLKEKSQALSMMQAKEEQIKHFVNQLREEITRTNDVHQSKQHELQEELSRKEQEFEESRLNYENQINGLFTEMERIQSVLKDHVTEQKKREALVESLNKQLKDVKEENENYRSANTDLILRIRDAEKASGTEVTKLKETLKQQCETLNSELKETKKQLSDFHHRELDQQKRITEMEQEKRSTKMYIETLEKRVYHQENKFSTPSYSNAPFASPGLSPISVGRSAKKKDQKKVESSQEDRPAPVAAVVTAQVKPRTFFNNIKPPGSKLGNQKGTVVAPNNQRTSPRTKNPEAVVLDSSAESVVPTNSANHERSDFDIFNLQPLDVSRTGFESDDESIVEVKVTSKSKKKH